MSASDYPQVQAYLAGHGNLELAAQELLGMVPGANGFYIDPPPDESPTARERRQALEKRLLELIIKRTLPERS